MTDERAVRLALNAGRYKAERDALRNRLRDLAATLDGAAQAAELVGNPPGYVEGMQDAVRIVRDQLERRPA